MTRERVFGFLLFLSAPPAFLGGYFVWENGGFVGKLVAGYLAAAIFMFFFALGERAARTFGIQL